MTTHKKEAREPNAEEYRIAREWLEANFNLPLHGLIYTRLADLLASRTTAPITAEQVEKAVKDSAEESDSTGAVFYHWQEAADALNKGRAAESPAGEQLEKLREQVRLAATRYRILLNRMTACGRGHDVSEVEIPGWIAEAKDTLARSPEAKELNSEK